MKRWLTAVLLAGAACSPDTATDVGSPAGSCAAATVPQLDALTQTGDVVHVHDPAIVVHEGVYFVFSTNNGIPIRRSRDLIHWEWVGRVFESQLPAWAAGEVPGVEAPWAPDVAWFNGRYHLYYSLSTFGSQRSAIGLATSATLDPSSPEYGWEDGGKVLESWPGVSAYNAIDPSIAFDENGQPWLAWGSWWGGIRLRRLDPATGRLSGADPVEHALAARSGGTQAVEGPAILRRGEFFYLFVSFDLCCRGAESTYNVRVGRSRSITGPYVDRAGTPMLQGGGSLVLGGYGRIRGPGHNSLLVEDGRELLVHHFYDARDGGHAKLQVRPLVWDADGWPLAGNPLDRAGAGPPPTGLDPQGRWGIWADNGPARSVELLSDGRVRGCDGGGDWSYAAPWLTLRWSATAQSAARTEAVRIGADGGQFTGRAADGRVLRGYRLE